MDCCGGVAITDASYYWQHSTPSSHVQVSATISYFNARCWLLHLFSCEKFRIRIYIILSEINMCATTLGCNRKQFTARLQRIWRFTYMQKDRPFTTESRWCKLCVQQLRVKRGPVVEVYILLIRKLEDFQSQCTTPPH